MSDTVRTRAQILSLLGDNSAGDISPQDLRDAIVSLFGVYGVIYGVDNTTAQTLAAATPVKLINFTKNGLGVGSTPDFANGKITLDNGGVYVLFAQGSLKSSIADKLVGLQFYLDAVATDAAPKIKFKDALYPEPITVLDLVSVNAGQELSLYVESDGIADITAIDMQIMALRIG